VLSLTGHGSYRVNRRVLACAAPSVPNDGVGAGELGGGDMVESEQAHCVAPVAFWARALDI